MMSRTVRYFKLIYMAAGILMSNADICETVDSIQIAPRVEMKEKNQQPINKNQQLKKTSRYAIEDKPEVEKKSVGRGGGSTTWLLKLSLAEMVDRIKSRIRPHLPGFSIWSLPNYVIDYSTNLLCRKFIINSDCDVIYK
ncbi:uncharacterized protein [Musca autumnalis]|uniref:uncharacterized protein n=1 Tax=Musca autumnalis TaxID=221902 RepID=UPI003CECC209